MPEPIIDPTTIVVESNNPSPRTNPDDSVSAGSAVTTVFVSDTGFSLVTSARENLERLAELCSARLQARIAATPQ